MNTHHCHWPLENFFQNFLHISKATFVPPYNNNKSNVLAIPSCPFSSTKSTTGT